MMPLTPKERKKHEARLKSIRKDNFDDGNALKNKRETLKYEEVMEVYKKSKKLLDEINKRD